MSRIITFVTLFSICTWVYAQSDEFDVFEINSSQESLNPDNHNSDIDLSVPVENKDPFNDIAVEDPALKKEAPTAKPDTEPVVEDNTVIVREKIDITPLSPEPGSDGLVELRSANDIYLPYKQRQYKWGFLFSAGAEIATFPSLVSQFDDAATFEEVFGSAGVTMASVEFGPKYNMSWGSLGLLFGYGNINSTAKSQAGANSTLELQRYSATLIYYLDTLWKEPYFAPYVGAGVWAADYRETTEAFPNEAHHYSTDIGYHLRGGALFTLDWLEPRTALRSRRTLGLQATFLNVYVSSSFMSESEPDPDLENDMDIGASLLLEF